MKLEVGMYVRTKRGQIGKIITIGRDNIAIEFNKMWQDIISMENVIKASFDIIDILEVGDYANGYKVTKIGGTYHGRKDRAIYCDYQQNEKTKKWIMIYDDEIKSIVTHEQMEQMAYKVGE